MTSWKNRLRRMLLLDKLEPLVSQTQKVADFGAKSATGNIPTAGCQLDGGERTARDSRQVQDGLELLPNAHIRRN